MRAALEHPGTKVAEIAIASVRTEPGIHPLLPYFTQYIAETVMNELGSLARLQCMIQLTSAIVMNENVYIEPYLHQVMPAVITCVVAQRLGAPDAAAGVGVGGRVGDPKAIANRMLSPPSASSSASIENLSHWTLRQDAAKLTGRICTLFGRSYATLEERVARTFFRAFLDPNKSFCTHYGAIMGLIALGPNVVQRLVLPNAAAYMDFFRQKVDAASKQQESGASPADGDGEYEARMCKMGLMTAVGVGARESARSIEASHEQVVKTLKLSAASAEGSASGAAGTAPATAASSHAGADTEDQAKDGPKEDTLLKAAQQDYVRECRALDAFLHKLVDESFGDELLPYIGVTIPPL